VSNLQQIGAVFHVAKINKQWICAAIRRHFLKANQTPQATQS
jgi:hypothetical protein